MADLTINTFPIATGPSQIDDSLLTKTNSLLKYGGVNVVLGDQESTSPVSGWANIVSYVRANDYVGSDGDAVTSIIPSAGTSDAFTGTCTLKTGVNGINSKKVFRGNGTTNAMVTTTGGASLSGDFYMAAVVRFTSVAGVNGIISFGSNASNQFRYLVSVFGDYYYFVPSGADVKCQVGPVASVGTLVEARCTSGVVSVWIDGVFIVSASPTLSAFASTVLRLMQSPAGNEFLTGDIAEAAFVGRSITDAERTAYLRYVGVYYGIGAAAGTTTSGWNVSDLLLPVQQYEYTGYKVYGGYKVLTYSKTLIVSAGSAAHSFYGPVVMNAPDAVHAFRSRTVGENVVSVRNEDPSNNGFSTIAYEDKDGKEHGAAGVAPVNKFPWGGPNGSFFAESSNFADTSKYGDAREVQSKSDGNLYKLRKRTRDDTNAIEQYDLTATEPSVGGSTAGLVSLTGKPATSVANDATLNTNITTGAGQCGIVVVKDATNSRTGVYRLENATLTLISANAIFGLVADAPVLVNVYNSGGQIILQNKTGGSLNLTAAYYGA